MLAKCMSLRLPVLSSHREWQVSDFTLDMEAAEVCDTVIDVLYVLLFLDVETDFQGCWMLKDVSKASKDPLWIIKVCVVLMTSKI